MTRRPRPIPNPTDPSLKALPKLKGGYYRRVKDIERALDLLNAKGLPPEVYFLFLYFGCEKLGLAIVGVESKFASQDAYGHGKFVMLRELLAAKQTMGLSATDTEVESIFGPSNTSARQLRHSLTHDLGPSNVKNVRAHCAGHIRTMEKFLKCIREFHDYQRANF